MDHTVPTYDYEDDDSHRNIQHALWKVIAPTLFAFTVILGILSNTGVWCRVCCRGWRTAGDCLFLALTFPSLLFLIGVVPFTGYTYLSNTWALGEISCKIFRATMFAFSCMKAYGVLVFCAYVHSLETDPHALCAVANRKSVLILSGLLWMFMLIICSPVYFLSEAEDVDDFLGYCSIARHHDIVVLCYDAIGFLIPVVASIVLLVRSCTRAPDSAPRRMDEVPWRCLGVSVLTAFALMWLPLHLNNVLAFVVDLPSALWYEAWRILSTALAYFDMALTPIIYLAIAGTARGRTLSRPRHQENSNELQSLTKSATRV